MYLNENAGKRPVIVTISGKAENGKDFTANELLAQLRKRGVRAVIAHYADVLKFICRQFYGWNGEKDEAGRALLQYVGTEVYRFKDMHFWVEELISFFNKFKAGDKLKVGDFSWEPPEVVIIPDARFPNEIAGWVANGHTVIPLAVRRYDLKKTGTDDVAEVPSCEDIVDASLILQEISKKNIEIVPYLNHLTSEAQLHSSETALDPYVFNVGGQGLNPNIRIATDADVNMVFGGLSEYENLEIFQTMGIYMQKHTVEDYQGANFMNSELQSIPFEFHFDAVFKAMLELTMRVVVNFTGAPGITKYQTAKLADSICDVILKRPSTIDKFSV